VKVADELKRSLMVRITAVMVAMAILAAAAA